MLLSNTSDSSWNSKIKIVIDITVILFILLQESEHWESIRNNTQLQTTTVEMTIVRAVELITVLIMKMVPDL